MPHPALEFMVESLSKSGNGPEAEGGGGFGGEDFSQAPVGTELCQLSIIWAYQLRLASD